MTHTLDVALSFIIGYDRDMIPYDVDRHGRILPKASEFSNDPKQFQRQLERSLTKWQTLGLPTVWLTVTERQADLIPVAVALGFHFHHTNNDALNLVYKFDPDAFVLHYASHYIGAGGLVINENNELLTIRQQPLRNGRKPGYKLPGGFIEVSEHLSDGVRREVLEETGIETEFESVIGFRLWHLERFGKSDIYFVCCLRPLSYSITRQESEIAEAIWMPVAEFLTHEDVSVFNRGIVQTALANQGFVSTWFDGYHADPAMKQKIELFLPNHPE
ncbi:MAG: NUDIX domain-containing protein [Chloroflexota bacterium]